MALPEASHRARELRVLLSFFGWALLVGSATWALASAGVFEGWLPEEGYLWGLLSRTLSAPFQLALAAGVLAVPLHVAWVFATLDHARGPYDAFAGWAGTVFTSLGFLGTVVGISLAVGGLAEAMEAQAPDALIAGLATAFDTTFLGLSGAIALMAARKLVAVIAR
ncbi:MAG: MotA/TolQ/ExbB proton channel family protein [Shimia sp.]